MIQTDTYALPFDDSWLVFWGGDTEQQNIHHSTISQRYAYDFIKVDKTGKFFKTDGKTQEDYYSFGVAVKAPANGIVVEAVEGLRDNLPGELNSFNFLGNYIMIKHGTGAFSVLGHLQQGSVLVTAGQTVTTGQLLAKCGNSGYTTDPHIHYHVQDSATFAKIDSKYNEQAIAIGKKICFKRLTVIKNDTQETVENYSPVKGDLVQKTA